MQDNKNRNTGATLKMKKRLNRVVIGIMLICFTVLIFNVGYITLAKNNYYLEVAKNQQLDDIIVDAKRGTIYDRNMKTLALSAPVWTVFISPVEIKKGQEEVIAKGLAKILDVPKKEVLEKVEKSNKYQTIKKKVEKKEVDEIAKFKSENKITAIHTIEDSKRYYPYGDFASSIIGFTGDDNKGLYGIEAYYDDYLRGTPGRTISAVNGRGVDMPFSYKKFYEPKAGNGLVLTIDESIQHFAETTLEKTVVQHRVNNRTCAIVMDVNSGEILAMASKPDFDLNKPFEISKQANAELQKYKGKEKIKQLGILREAQWKNKAITELYEPGSVFKVITGSAALEEKVVSVNSTFSCSGVRKIGGETMHCWKTEGHGHLDLTGAYVGSCNPAFMTIGERLGATKFYNYLKSYGINDKTGIDLPGEERSLTIPQIKYGPVELASSSFGQSNKITPLQMMVAFSATVNGGYLVQPHMVKQRLDNEGNVLETYEPAVKRQVISEETSAQMREMLEECVSADGGTNAFIKGYRIGGKSGTSQKLDSSNEKSRVSSFIGFAPADKPQIAVLVMVDEPTAGEVYGSKVAAPPVSVIMADTLPYLGIEKVYSAEESKKLEVNVPNVKGQLILEAETEISNAGLICRVQGNGHKVIRQLPDPDSDSTMSRGGTVILYTEKGIKEQKVTVPNLTGLSPSVASNMLKNLNLNIKLSGGAAENPTAKIKSQSIAADKKVPTGTVIKVICESKSEG